MSGIAIAVYILCAATSVACAVLLLSSYRKSGMTLLWWSGLCFIGLAFNNLFLMEDLVFAPDIDFSIPRNLSGVVGVSLLLYGLLWKQTIKTMEDE